jgi:hypothetical protein
MSSTTGAPERRRDLERQLEQLLSECALRNWDGHDADAVTACIAKNTHETLRLLPDELLPDELVPGPDGAISLSWWISGSCCCSISVDADDEFHFAGVFPSHGVRHGIAAKSDLSSGSFLNLLKEVSARPR